MASTTQVLASLLLLSSAVVAAPGVDARSAPNPFVPYAPAPGFCPSGSLVRSANGLGSQEQAWISKRKPITDKALASWVAQFGSFPASSMPNVGMALAGGFLRASLLGAGIHQQLNGGEGTGPMSGLLQGIQYETTLSGSAAYQAGLQQNNWPSIASLAQSLWVPNYATGMQPGAAQNEQALAISQIAADASAKTAASYPLTLIDVYGRIIGWSNLKGNDGGVNSLLSDTQSQSNFVNANVPFPIMTSIGTVDTGYSCVPGLNGTQYELTPFEFGSWDYGVSSFMKMKYLGTRMLSGRPATPVCTTGFDNLGFMVGTSANTLAWDCVALNNQSITNPLGGLAALLDPFNNTIGSISSLITGPFDRNVWSAIPNPFYRQTSSPLVQAQPELYLVDGGNSGQVIPLWPLLHRNLDVVFVWDNYYDLDNTYTTGTQLYNTYVAAQAAGLKSMPQIPTVAQMQAAGQNRKPTAFGCNDNTTSTFIYVPYDTFVPQTQATNNLTTTPEQTNNYIKDGNLLATNNGNTQWPQCVACLVMKKKATSLPSFCNACFTTYCAT